MADEGFFVFGFEDAVLPTGGVGGPGCDVLIVEEHDVEIICSGKLAELVNFVLGIDAFAGGDLGHEAVAVAGDAFEGDAEHLVHFAVGFGGFKKADTVVVGMTDEAGELVLTEFALRATAHGAGAEGEAGDFDAGFAEGDPIGGGAGSGAEGAVGKAGGGESGGGEAIAQEFTAGTWGHRNFLHLAGSLSFVEVVGKGEAPAMG